LALFFLAVGWSKYRTEVPPVPYYWSITLCKVQGVNQWVGLELGQNDICPTNITVATGTPQSFSVPSFIFEKSVPYAPVLFVTNKVAGELEIYHTIDSHNVFTTFADTRAMQVTEFASCGGKEIAVYRDGPLFHVEGDYVTTDCTNPDHGCQYEPARSLDKYSFDLGYLHLNSVPSTGSKVIINKVVLDADPELSIIMPEAYLYYEVAGKGETQDVGLILLIIGAIFADLMPPTLYFVISATKKKPHGEDIVIGSSVNSSALIEQGSVLH